MKLSRFSQLQRQVQALGADFGPARVAYQLRNPGIEVNPEELAGGDYGLYHIDPTGYVARVLVYQDQFDIDQAQLPSNLREKVMQGGFDNSQLIDHLPTVHLFYCKALRDACAEQWPANLVATLNTTGRFRMHYTRQGAHLIALEEQVLNICPCCLEMLRQRYRLQGPLKTEDVALDKFLAPSFIDHPDKNIGAPRDRSRTCASVLAGYQEDWRQISNTYQQLTGCQCQRPDCNAPDLADPDLLPFLHTHCVAEVDTDPYLIQVQSLCIRCHAQERGHQFLIGRREFRDYVQRRETSPLSPA